MRCHRPPCLEPRELPSPGFEVAPVSEELRPLNRERPPLVGRSFHCSNQISFLPSGVSLAPSGVSTSPLAITSVPSKVFHAPSEGFSVRILTSQTSKTEADNLREALGDRPNLGEHQKHFCFRHSVLKFQSYAAPPLPLTLLILYRPSINFTILIFRPQVCKSNHFFVSFEFSLI